MRLILSICTILLLFINISSSEMITKPKHHLPDGTFSNPSGKINSKNFAEMFKWGWERRGKKVETFNFPQVEPNFEAINRNEDLLITWIGHASFLYQNNDLNVLLDPHCTNRASPFSFAGPERYTPPGMTVDQFPDIDVITISHNHYDHLDKQTVTEISKKYPKALFLVPLGLQKWFEDKGINNVIELDWWESKTVKNTEITFAPVQHWSARGLFDRNESLWGAWHFNAPKHSFIHLGDTGYSDDFKNIYNRLGPVNLAAIPIGAYEPRCFMKFSHMNPEEAVMAFQDLKAEQAIGMHWGTFILTDEKVTEPPEKLEIALSEKEIDLSKFITLKHGQTFILD